MTITVEAIHAVASSNPDRLRDLLITANEGSVASRSVKQQQRLLSLRLRAQGHTWSEIAHWFADQFNVNMRVACRLMHGYSQSAVIDRWNRTWPDEPKTFKNLSYWEQWPAPTGHTPSLRVLQRLAHLYECRVADLVADIPAEAVHG